jgi:DNA repair protein RadC
VAAPAAADPERCRSVLVGLLAPLAPDDAGGWATALIAEFGSLPGLLCASHEAKCRVIGDRPEAIALIEAVGGALSHAAGMAFRHGPVLAGLDALLTYLRLEQAFSLIELARVLHLDTKNHLIRDEVISRGTIDEAAIHVREVIRRAVELHSAAIILVHNHPSGDPTPSRSDIDLTRRIVRAGQPLGIAVHDHLIVASSGHSSMRELGLL